MADTPTAEELKLEKAKANMAGSPVGTVPEAAPEAGASDPTAGLEAEAEKAGKDYVQRYIPPDPPKSVLEQLEEMKAAAPAPAPTS